MVKLRIPKVSLYGENSLKTGFSAEASPKSRFLYGAPPKTALHTRWLQTDIPGADFLFGKHPNVCCVRLGESGIPSIHSKNRHFSPVQ